MSLSDLELLQLVDTLKAKQRGPKGETGVGISEIDQFDETGFTIRLTDGSFKRVNLPAPKDGDVGPVGPAGPVGESGSAGRPGRDGVQGPAGRDGADGLPGSFVETAVVNGDGHLLLGISDGSIIDVGRVVGPAGATGAVGATGLAGESGKDGAAVLSGPRAPQADDGVEGDHWIDISSAEFSFFKKNGEGWTKLAELRHIVTPGPVTAVGGGGGSGGGGELQNTATLPLANPSRYKNHGRVLPPSDGLKSQKDLNEWVYSVLLNFDADGSKISVGANPPDPAEVGMLWFSTNADELTLFIYVPAVAAPLGAKAEEGDWVPAAPPVSLDGIEQHTMELEANVQALWKSTVPFDVFLPYAQKIDLLETELDKLEGVFIDVDLTYKFGYAPQRAPGPGCAYLRVGDDASSQKPTYAQAGWLNVSNVDRAGNPIDWATVVVNNEVIIESLDGSGFGIYKCWAPVFEADNWIKIQLVLDSEVEENNEGKPVENELVRIKCSDTAGLSNYVRKSGDTMNGTLNISQVPESKTGDGPLKLYGLKPSPTNQDDIITGPIFQGGHVPTGSFLQYTGRTSNKSDLVNKGYVDNKARTSEIELSQLAEDETDPDLLARISAYENPTQEDLNNEIGWSLFNQRRKGTRTSTNLDIVQNTKVSGQWIFVEPGNPENELPLLGDFFLLDADGQWTQEWSEAKTLRINGGDGRAADLSTVRRGTQWLIQDVALNTFAHYITNSVEFTGSVEGGQFVVEAEISAIYGRAFGGPVVDTVCEVKAFSPHPCISTNDGSKPVVDDDGYLWYDEQTKKLYVSDWDDDQPSNGEAQWIEVGAGSGEVTGDYLPLTGGLLTGKLETTDKIWIRPDGKGASGANNMLVVNQEGADGGSIARFQQSAVDILKIEHSRNINACGNHITDVANPTAVHHAANKEYVDNAVAGIDLGDKYATKLDINTARKGAYLIFNCNKKDKSIYADGAIYWVEDSSKVKLIVSCDALDDFAQIRRDRYRGPDKAKVEWETPISIMRLSGEFFEDENPILQAKTEHVRVLTYNGNKYFQIWFDPNNALTWRPDAFTGTQEGVNPDSVRSRISISGIWSPH